MAAGMGAGVARHLPGSPGRRPLRRRGSLPLPGFRVARSSSPPASPAIIAYCTFGLAFGWDPLFNLTPAILKTYQFQNPLQLVPYLFLAVFMVVLAMLYTRTFYGLHAPVSSTALRAPLQAGPGRVSEWSPGAGACISSSPKSARSAGTVGPVVRIRHPSGCADLSGRQDRSFSGSAPAGGGSGQDPDHQPDHRQRRFGRRLRSFDGDRRLRRRSPGNPGCTGPFRPLCRNPASFVIVGMAGFFAAAAKTPFSTLVIVSEMTGNYNLLLPTLWVCAITFLLSDEQSIYSSQVESRSRSPAHQGDYVREVLTGMKVDQFLKPLEEVPALKPGDRLPEVLERLDNTPYQTLPVTNAQGHLLGVVSLEEVHLATQFAHLQSLIVAADLMRSDVVPLRPDDHLDRAMELFVEQNLLVLPVIDGSPQRRVIGLVRAADVSSTYLRHVQGETLAKG